MLDPGLLAEVLAHPDDDAPRLVLADWCEENGQPERAEFIRCQCMNEAWVAKPGEVVKWAGGTVSGAQAGAALARSQRLMREDGPLRGLFDRYFYTPEGPGFWIGGLCFHVTFRRGFVEAVTCTADAWLAHADAILACQPVREVTLTTWPEVHSQSMMRGGEIHYRHFVGPRTSPRTVRCIDLPGPPNPLHAIVKVFEDLWPRIRFTMPPVVAEPSDESYVLD